MVNRNQSMIKFRQALIFAVNEVIVTSFIADGFKDQDECITLHTATGQVVGDAQDNFKNKLQNFFQVIGVEKGVLQRGSDLTVCKNAHRDAALDLDKSVGKLWQSFK